ncbi:D-amino-acid transaminase [Salibacterium aidingense]|uniref:D-amino-acid transaminase n=1 Tax=Salibacterium aidingense TaxID=384933 RepID=UPI0004081C84|nr:D-amino-acid transaminase [Salibacterium aidingense]
MDYVLIKNEFVRKDQAYIDFYDRGYYFGDGIYEVIRVYNGIPFLWEEHFERLQRSARELDLEFSQPVDDMKKNILSLIAKNNLQNGIVYFQITRGEQERNHLYPRTLSSVLTAFTKEDDSPVSLQENGISLWALDDIRWLRCDIKTINLLGNVMAKRKAEDEGCHEALQHRGNIVTEGSSTNVYLVKDGTIYTHPANHYILNGITRLFIKQLASEEGISFQEEAFTLEDIPAAEEMFISSTSHELVPVTKIKGSVTKKLAIGPITRRLQKAFASAEN